MNYISGIDGMDFNPISDYNSYIQNNKAFDVDINSDFENVLNQKTAEMQNTPKIQGGIEVSNFDIESANASPEAGNFANSFINSVNNGLNSVNDKIHAAEQAQEAFAMGEDVSVHDLMIASEKASLSLQLAMQIRNKLTTAYNEINNVRV